MKKRFIVLLGVLSGSSGLAADFCTDVNPLIKDGQNHFARISEGKGAFESFDQFKLGGATHCMLMSLDKNEIGALKCEWKYSRFKEAAQIAALGESMIKGFKACWAPLLSEIQNDTPTSYVGRLKDAKNDWVDVSTTVEDDPGRKVLALYFTVSRFEE